MIGNRRSLRRRPLLIIFLTVVILYILLSLGPPVFSPSTTDSAREKATQWTKQIKSYGPSFHRPATTAPAAPEVPRIRQATMIYEGDKDHLQKMYERAIDTHLRHGERWGTPTHILKHALIEEGSFYNKLAWILNLVTTELAKEPSSRSEWIVWFDADSVIMNQDVPWSIFLPPDDFKDKHILGSRDLNGFNAGMLILHVHQWTVNMLTQAIALPSLEPKTVLPFFDQSAIENICNRSGYAEHFIYQPRHWWNRYSHDKNGEEQGELVIHFAGMNTVGKGTETKIEIMTKYLDRAEQGEKGGWTKQLSETHYPSEAEGFWEKLRKARRALEAARARIEKHDVTERQKTAAEEKIRELSHIILKEADNLIRVDEGIANLQQALS